MAGSSPSPVLNSPDGTEKQLRYVDEGNRQWNIRSIPQRPRKVSSFCSSYTCLTSAGCRLTIIAQMRVLFLLKTLPFLLIIMLCGLLPPGSLAGELQDTKVRDERRVTLQVADVPLNEVLSILAKNVPLEIRGTVPSQERITVQFSNLTLEEALSRIMRGFNYVLVRPEESAKPLLVVMNKIERSIRNEPASAGPVPAGPVPVPAGLPGVVTTQPGRPQQPGIPPSAQGPGALPTRVGPTETGQAGPQRPDYQPGFPGSVPGAGTVPPFPGMPFGPGILPPGMAAGQPGPAFVPGNLPPGIPPPGATNPPPEGAGASGPQPIPQQPAQPTPEPTRVMTPFGERPMEPGGAGP